MAKAFFDANARLFYYWVSFGPLSRGSAACGYVVLAGLHIAAGLKAPPPKMPPGRQLDWEAILTPTPRAFVDDHTAWLQQGLDPDPIDRLADLPSPDAAFPTLRDRVAALAAP